MVSLTISRAMDTLWQNYAMNSNPDETDDPAKNILNAPFNSFMDNEKDVHTTEDAKEKFLIQFDHTAIPLSETRDENAPPVDISFVNSTNDTMNLADLNLESVMEDSMDDVVDGPADEPTIIFIRPKPKIFTVQVREFHECVSCSKQSENLFL